MKNILFLFLSVFFGAYAIAQGTFKTSQGEIHFNASTPLEDIDATNKKVNAIFKWESGDFASVLLMKDFSFKRKLMQEHFNENYVESETYPKAYFSGNIKNFDPEGLSSSPKQYVVDGKMTIHGVTKELQTQVFLKKTTKGVSITSEFIIKPEDYNIEVPKLLFKKIAKEVKVDITLNMVEQ